MSDEGYVIYVPEEMGFLFFRSALMTVMQVSEAIYRDYGKWAENIVFRGEYGKAIFDNFMLKKYNLNASMTYEPSPNEEIVMELSKKIKVKRGDVIRSIGFEYTIEKDEKPQITISLIKLF